MDLQFQKRCLNYLGLPENVTPDAALQCAVESARKEVEKVANFQYVYSQFVDYQNFIKENIIYTEYLAGSESYLLCATTLGIRIDQRLKRLQLEDMKRAVVFDAVASAFLELRADEFEAALPFRKCGFRFCPGYGGTSIADNREIARLLHAERIGISFLDSGLMVPCKSMVGIVRIGASARKSCANCVTGGDCTFRRRGTTCYGK